MTITVNKCIVYWARCEIVCVEIRQHRLCMIRVDISAKYGNKCNGIGIENCSWFTVHPAVCWAVRLYIYIYMYIVPYRVIYRVTTSSVLKVIEFTISVSMSTFIISFFT